MPDNVDTMPAEVVDRAACVAAFGDWRYPIIKHADDLDRYRQIIEATRPEVIVETGTRHGGSARWFASRGVDVISIDVDRQPVDAEQGAEGHGDIIYLRGNSIDPQLFETVAAAVAGRRCMVSLDSDHSEWHVRREVELYRELVSPGCYLVVEDGVIDWLPSPKPHDCDVYTGSVLAAIAVTLPGDGRFGRDTAIETAAPVTMNPAGWWVRHG